MKIAIDARMINMSGIGSYIKSLLNQDIYEVAIGDVNEIEAVSKDMDIVEFNEKIYSIKEQLKFPTKELKKRGVTLLHIPHYNVPMFYRGDFAVTVHDLIHLVLPEFLPNKLAYWYAKIVIGYAVRKAKVVFTVSENSKNDIVRMFKANPEKIVVTYNCVDPVFVHKDKEDVEYLKEKYKLPSDKKVIMYVGNLKPHKNLLRLMEAYAKINSDNAVLLLVGKAFDNRDIDETIERLGLGGKVIKTGIVERDELVDFYNLADLFAFPSLYEGFGIPPLEAMACGTPVVSTNTSSLPEVVADAALTFDPYNVDEIAKALTRGLEDESLREELITKGYERAKNFSKQEIAEKTKEALCNFK